MAWHAKLGGQFTIFADGVDLGPPENRTVGVLLIGLLSRDPNWSSREELSQLLYPESDPVARRSALRQSLFRLRRLLGTDALEETRDRVRLAESCWTYDFLLESGKKASAPMIAPGLTHPWIEAVRLEWAPPTSTTQSQGAADFAAAVQSVARDDPDTARRLLVGGALLTDGLSLDTFGTLLGLTEPKDRRDPLVFEHIQMRRSLYERLGCYTEAKAAQTRAYRLAVQQRHAGHMVSAGALVLFMEIEDGQLGEAAAWVDYLQNALNADTRSLLFCNARAAYLWNMNRLDEAVAQMSQAIRRIPSTDRATRLHFYTNYSVLCAEAGMVELGLDAQAEARALVIPGLDVFQLMTLDLAEATRLMQAKRTDEAIVLLEGNRSGAAARGHVFVGWYATEAMAEALAIAGRTAEARRLWSKVEGLRLRRCARLTPRLLARRTRIMRGV
jgi:tetratricopeptide (TPR) repeat protein